MRIRCYNAKENGTWIVDTEREFKKAKSSEYPHSYKAYIHEVLEDLKKRESENIISHFEVLA